jgi:hypothetical protein
MLIMRTYLFGLTRVEQEMLSQAPIPSRTYSQLARFSSSIAPALSKPIYKKRPWKSTLAPEAEYSYQPARYFDRGAIENDRKRNPVPFFFLLTETDEKLRPRPLPRNRNLLLSLCRGKGILRQNERGHVYLDIDNQFILALLPYLTVQGLARPPYFNLFSSPDGAHIPIIPAREAYFQDIASVSEIGREFSFELEGLYSVQPSSWPEVEEVWFFKVHCPELEQLRRKYFLPPLPGGHFFIIATAVQSRTASPVPTPTFRISPVVSAA